MVLAADLAGAGFFGLTAAFGFAGAGLGRATFFGAAFLGATFFAAAFFGAIFFLARAFFAVLFFAAAFFFAGAGRFDAFFFFPFALTLALAIACFPRSADPHSVP